MGNYSIYKQAEWDKITNLQNAYVDELIEALRDEKNKQYESINFNSATGTGKTHMIIRLINSMPDYFFIVTTLSKAKLNEQTQNKLSKYCKGGNFIVYGNCDFSANTKKQKVDFMCDISNDKPIIWIRDESHIKTENFMKIFKDKVCHIVNFSATNNVGLGIDCDFSDTAMLRKINQKFGNPKEALEKLIEVKEQHKNVPNYNPCAIFRDVSDSIVDTVIKLCNEYNLKYIDLTNKDYEIAKLCEDDNEYDVIINKFKLVEGTDMKRAHIFYFSNEPSNINTIIQCVGRCRRNALHYRDDIDIYVPENAELLNNTLQCYIYFNTYGTRIDEDENGNLVLLTTDNISIDDLKCGEVEVINGRNADGLFITELANMSGKFNIEIDADTGLKFVSPETPYYKQISRFYSETQNNTIRKTDSFIIPLTENTKVSCNKGRYNFTNSFTLAGDKLNLFINTLSELKKKKDSYYVDLGENRYKRYEIHHFTPILAHINLYDIVPDVWDNINSADDLISMFNLVSNESVYTVSDKNINNTIFGLNLIQNHIVIHIDRNDAGLSIEDFIELVKSNNNSISYNWLEIDCKEDELDFPIHKYHSYSQIYNDREIGLIGVDGFKPKKNNNGVNEITLEKTVTSRVARNNSKLTRFIIKKYNDVYTKALRELDNIYSTNPINPNFPSKCNSCRGYIVEYLIKTMLYGEKYLGLYYYKSLAKDRSNENFDEDMLHKVILVDACMFMYCDEMKETYPTMRAKAVKTLSAHDFIHKNYNEFVLNCYALAENALPIITQFIPQQIHSFDSLYFNPNLSVSNISALCDIISEDTIIDIKVTGKITPQYIRQVLAYHYLSTKRSDLHIKTLVIYEAITNQFVKIDL